MAPREAARAYLECAHHYGRATFGGLPDLEAFCQAAQSVVEASDPAGLALFAGYLSEPLPDDAPARALQLVATLRDLRGSVHLMAVVASGLSPRVAHFLRRPDDFTLFGWGEADVPQVTEDDRRRQAEAEALTDRLLVSAYASLDERGAEALVAGVEQMAAASAS